MPELWRLLSGEVPGGFALPIVLLIAFYLVLLYVYRVGEIMPRRTYRRWQRLGPIIILVGYALVWLQSPPKVEPLRLAVIVDEASEKRWQTEALADLTARRLARTLPGAVVNPWEGAADEYPQPPAEILLRSNYRLYQLRWVLQDTGSPASVRVEGADGNQFIVEDARADFLSQSEEISRWVLNVLGKSSELAEPFRKVYPPSALEAYYRGCCLLRSEKSDEAGLSFLQALEIDSTFALARIGLARSLEAGADRQWAEVELLNAVKADTGSSEALLCLGEFYLRGRQWDRAEPPLKVVLIRNPLAVRAYLGLAGIHPARLKDLRLDSPSKLLKEAVRLDPAFEAARVSLASRLIDAGVAQEARKVLQEGLRINSTSEALLLKMGAAELYSGNTRGARRAYEQILARDPRNAAAAFNLGVVDYRGKQYDRAMAHFNRSLDLQGPVDCYYYLGMIYRAEGDSAQARFYFLKRWDLRQGDDDVYAVKAKEYADALVKASQG